MRVQHGCSSVPELVGRLQRVLVDFVMSRGERLSGSVLDPLDPSHLGHSPAYADQCHLRPWENPPLLEASLSLVPVQPRLEGGCDRGEAFRACLVDRCGDAELAVVGKGRPFQLHDLFWTGPRKKADGEEGDSFEMVRRYCVHDRSHLLGGVGLNFLGSDGRQFHPLQGGGRELFLFDAVVENRLEVADFQVSGGGR